MELIKILFKMIRYHRKDYMLYLYCNIFTMALLLAFLSVCSNHSLMHNYQVDPMIADNILFPSLMVCLFTLLFLPYAYEAFLKGRKQEYSVLMTLGMTEREVIANMFLECFAVSSAGCILGLICGSGLSVLFFLFLRRIIGITPIQWEFHGSAYLTAVGLYALVIILILLLNIIRILKANLSELLQAKWKEERKQKGSKALLFLGCAVFLVSILSMLYVFYSGKTNFWLLSMGSFLMGTFLAIFHSDSVLYKNSSRKWKISFGLLLQNLKSWKIVTIISSCLFGLIVFFSGLCFTIYSYSMHNAIAYSPYDLFYVRDQNSNQMELEELEQILNRHGISLVSQTQVCVLRSGAFNILSADEINEKLGKDYHPCQGSFIQLFQEDLKDGYEHELLPVENVTIKLGDSKKLPLALQEQRIEILFNPCKSLADTTLIVNSDDFKRIAKQSEEYFLVNAILINLDNWKISGPAIAELQNCMAASNNFSQEAQYLSSLSSKIGTYTIEKQSSEVLIFWIFFVDLMFFGAANVTIYFKIKSELKEDTRMIYHLYRIGITEKETWNILFKKNLCYYLPSLIMGIGFGIFYCFSVNSIYHYGLMGFICAGLTAAAAVLLQFFLIFVITRYEYSEVNPFP